MEHELLQRHITMTWAGDEAREHMIEHSRETQKALGYFMHWGAARLQYVGIVIANDGTLTACYWHDKASFENPEVQPAVVMVGEFIPPATSESLGRYSNTN